MISEELNKRLTEIGPGTPAGELFRRYWQPVAGIAELSETGRKKVRILGEDLILFRDASGKLGLIGERCLHRGCSLFRGIPDDRGLRCAYHGWLYSATGECLEQPAEPADSTFKDRLRAVAYPVQTLGGLVFAYLGPDPAPLLPNFDLFAAPNAFRTIGCTVLPVNWLQVMENSLDPVHFEWLHGHYGDSVFASKGQPLTKRMTARHIKIAFDRFEYGIIKRRLVEGRDETSDEWAVGHPIVFPNMLRLGLGSGISGFQIRVPIDDENTLIWWYNCYRNENREAPHQAEVPVIDVPYRDADGELIVDTIEGQDMMVWVSQGTTGDRSHEHLGTSDRGIVTFRRMLQEEMGNIADGKDPIGVIRDASLNEYIELPEERKVHFLNGSDFRDHVMRSPTVSQCPPELAEEIIQFLS